MVALNTSRYRDVPTGKMSCRRSFLGKYILTVEIQKQVNTKSFPTPAPPHYSKEQKAAWDAGRALEYEKGWHAYRVVYRDAREEDMNFPVISVCFEQEKKE